MKRMKVMFGQRRIMVLATLAILVLAAAALAASSASFTATSANPGNVFTAGDLDMYNSKDGSLILTSTNIKPGDIVSSTVTLRNIGSVDGAFTVSKTLQADAAGLGGVLQLSIDEGAANVYSGDLSGALSSVSLGTWIPSEEHTYTFTVSWPGGTGVPDDDAFQGTSCTYAFQWDAVSN